MYIGSLALKMVWKEFKGNEVTNIQLGATNNADQASIIKGIIDSIKINN
jgi:hypothetical protein